MQQIHVLRNQIRFAVIADRTKDQVIGMKSRRKEHSGIERREILRIHQATVKQCIIDKGIVTFRKGDLRGTCLRCIDNRTVLRGECKV